MPIVPKSNITEARTICKAVRFSTQIHKEPVTAFFHTSANLFDHQNRTLRPLASGIAPSNTATCRDVITMKQPDVFSTIVKSAFFGT